MNMFAPIALLAIACLTLCGPAQAQTAGPSRRFKDWQYDCYSPDQAAPDSGKPQQARPTCVIQHAVRRPDNDGSLLMLVRVRLLGSQRQPILAFFLPPSLKVSSPVSYSIDRGATATTTVRQCNKQICWAFVTIGNYLLATLKSGIQLTIDLTPGGNGPKIDVPLDGFTSAYAILLASP